MLMEYGPFRISKAQACWQPTIANVAPERGGCAACSSADDDPGGNGVLLARHLAEDGFGDVVVAPPIGRTFGIGELIHVVPAQRGCEARAFSIQFGCAVNEVALAAIEADRRDLLRRGGTWHKARPLQISDQNF